MRYDYSGMGVLALFGHRFKNWNMGGILFDFAMCLQCEVCMRVPIDVRVLCCVLPARNIPFYQSKYFLEKILCDM